MAITYDKKRNDITFCTMLFELPNASDFSALKRNDRKFENFYLPSLKQLIETFGRVALWCDQKTADYITANGLAESVNMRIMDFSELPHFPEHSQWLSTLHDMQRYHGNLLHKKTPEQWINYMILINAKPTVMDWAASENKFNTKYFMWLDAGSFNPMYKFMWDKWDGTIESYPESRVRITIQKTMGKRRPRFTPGFIYKLYKYIRGPIADATRDTLIKQDLISIATINADYDVPACSMMMTGEMTHRFHTTYERTRLMLKRHNLVTTEQAVFQAMMKFDTEHMFELSYIDGYRGVYHGVAKPTPDHILE